MPAANYFQQLVRDQHRGVPTAVCSICSSHPTVLRVAMDLARRDGSLLLVESTVNQVNQEGGYTGMTPAVFRDFLNRLADEAGLARSRLLLGADHVGPFPWKQLPAAVAMDKACRLTADLVKAGYAKIHLDASAPLPGDPKNPEQGLPPGLIAEREAMLASAAEAALDGAGPTAPVYVIGTDVPPPGGTLGEAMQTAPTTSPEQFRETVATCRDAFRRASLESAWDRVLAVVVQLGAEFVDQAVFPYDRSRTVALCAAARAEPSFVLEAHSTDYQDALALRQMVEDGAAILKVGPALTYAMREALFSLECIEQELADRFPGGCSTLRETLDRAMLTNPQYWRSYFHGDEGELRLSRRYSLLDRARYYWGVPAVQAAAARLLGNLRSTRLPASLLSQYCPTALARIRSGELPSDPEAIVGCQIREVLRTYRRAVCAETVAS